MYFGLQTPAVDGNDDDVNEAAIKLPDQMSLLEIVLIWNERINNMVNVFRYITQSKKKENWKRKQLPIAKGIVM